MRQKQLRAAFQKFVNWVIEEIFTDARIEAYENIKNQLVDNIARVLHKFSDAVSSLPKLLLDDLKDWVEKLPQLLKNDGLKVTAVIGAGIGVGCSVAAATPTALAVAGFTEAGVAAGSLAAAIQGPTVASGSLFALCQSIGAAGLGVAGLTTITGGAAVLFVAGYYALRGKKSQATVCEQA